MWLQVVHGRRVMVNGEHDPNGKDSWRAVAVTPPPHATFRPVWHVRQTGHVPSRTTYQVVWPGDLVLSARESGSAIEMYEIGADGSFSPKPAYTMRAFLDDHSGIEEWLLNAGEGDEALPPGVGWDGRWTVRDHQRADTIRRIFNGAPEGLVDKIVDKLPKMRGRCITGWEETEIIPSRMHGGSLWVVWSWIGPAEVHDLRDSSESRLIPVQAVRVARISIGADYVSWRLFDNPVGVE